MEDADGKTIFTGPIFDENGVTLMLSWSVDDVGCWVKNELNFPEYVECFARNFIDGSKLINVDASSLPKLGVTDFKHIKVFKHLVWSI